MIVITRWRTRRTAPGRPGYMTRAEHLAEAERLAWVLDDVLQTGTRRSLGDVIALARLHLELAREARLELAPGRTVPGVSDTAPLSPEPRQEASRAAGTHRPGQPHPDHLCRPAAA